MRLLYLATLLFAASLAALAGAAQLRAAPEGPLVLILVPGLTWKETRETPALDALFAEEGAVAALSTSQGLPPERRLGYALLGAGSRADTSVLPQTLPPERARLQEAFRGPTGNIRVGSLGEALEGAGLRAAAVGPLAGLVVMDARGEVPIASGGEEPVREVEAALASGADLVAAEVAGPEEAGTLVEAARRAGARVAVASPEAPRGSSGLTPLAIEGPGGILFSPATRTAGLVTSADLAPTLLDRLGVERPPEMQGSAATVREGSPERAERLAERLSFVDLERSAVWSILGVFGALALLVGGLLGGRRGLRFALLFAGSLPAGALLAAAFPLTGTVQVAALTAGLAGALAFGCVRLLRWPAGPLAGVCLATAALVAADAAAGGALMRFSTLGYNPAFGTRFYGIGNEYAAVLIGALAVGLGALAAQRRKLPVWLLAAVVGLAVVVLGAPAMGGDVGGSLAAGAGLGATAGLLVRKAPEGASKTLRRVVVWGFAGSVFAVAVFFFSGLISPDASHGARAASGQLDLWAIALQKLLLSLGYLTNPLLLVLFLGGAVLVYAGWRRARGALAAGLLGGALCALAVGALNDSGILAALFTLVHPALAAAWVLLLPSEEA